MATSLDFIGIPSTDWERSRAFYVDTLGFRPDDNSQAEVWLGETCFAIWQPSQFGMEFPVAGERAPRDPRGRR